MTIILAYLLIAVATVCLILLASEASVNTVTKPTLLQAIVSALIWPVFWIAVVVLVIMIIVKGREAVEQWLDSQQQ